MKIKHLAFAALAFAALVVGCKPNEENAAIDINVTPATISSVAAAGVTESLDIKCNGAWKITSDAAWVTVDPAVGDGDAKVSVKVAANESVDPRSASLKVSAGSVEKTVKVTQLGAEAAVKEASGWAIVGSWGNGWWLSERHHLWIDGAYYSVKGIEMAKKTEFKFFRHDDWKSDVENADNGGWGEEISGPGMIYPNQKIPAGGGNNICILEAGTYDIYLSADLQYFYVMTTGTDPSKATDYVEPQITDEWGLIGVNGDWTNDIELKADGDWYVAKNIIFSGSPDFKIRANASWSDATKNIGVAEDGQVNQIHTSIALVADANSKNIKVEAAGTYDIYFSLKDMVVWVMTAGCKPGDAVPAKSHELERWGKFKVADIPGVDGLQFRHVAWNGEYIFMAFTGSFSTEDGSLKASPKLIAIDTQTNMKEMSTDGIQLYGYTGAITGIRSVWNGDHYALMVANTTGPGNQWAWGNQKFRIYLYDNVNSKPQLLVEYDAPAVDAAADFGGKYYRMGDYLDFYGTMENGMALVNGYNPDTKKCYAYAFPVSGGKMSQPVEIAIPTESTDGVFGVFRLTDKMCIRTAQNVPSELYTLEGTTLTAVGTFDYCAKTPRIFTLKDGKTYLAFMTMTSGDTNEYTCHVGEVLENNTYDIANEKTSTSTGDATNGNYFASCEVIPYGDGALIVGGSMNNGASIFCFE